LGGEKKVVREKKALIRWTEDSWVAANPKEKIHRNLLHNTVEEHSISLRTSARERASVIIGLKG